jgi:hypothetical protein
MLLGAPAGGPTDRQHRRRVRHSMRSLDSLPPRGWDSAASCKLATSSLRQFGRRSRDRAARLSVPMHFVTDVVLGAIARNGRWLDKQRDTEGELLSPDQLRAARRARRQILAADRDPGISTNAIRRTSTTISRNFLTGADREAECRIRPSNYARAALRGGLSFYVRCYPGCYPERFFGLCFEAKSWWAHKGSNTIVISMPYAYDGTVF